MRPGLERWVVAAFALAATTSLLLTVGLSLILGRERFEPLPVAIASGLLAVVFGALTGGLRRLALLLPGSLDGSARRRRGLALLWVVAASFALFQTVRHVSFMVDPAFVAGSAFPFDKGSVEHMCLGAYVYAADLALEDKSALYDPTHFRAYTPGVSPAPSVVGLEPYLKDPFLYPPPFLLLPAAGLALTRDYLTLRTGWYLANALLFLAVALLVARRVGGPAGLQIGLLLPVLWLSTPTLFNLQYGQFHLAVLALSLLALLCFDRGLAGWGGLCLGLATVSKIFPGILLVDLLLRRRFKEATWTAAAILGLGLSAWAVFGSGPFEEFLTIHLGKVASGAAVEFFADDFPTVVNNVSAYSAVVKLSWLGLPGASLPVAEAVSWLFSLVPLAAVWWMRNEHGSLLWRLQVGLALLNLAAARSPNAPSIYVLVGSLWLLTLLAPTLRGRWLGLVLPVVAWILFLGLPPLPARSLLLTVSLVMQLLCLGLSWWAATRRPAESAPAEPRTPLAAEV